MTNLEIHSRRCWWSVKLWTSYQACRNWSTWFFIKNCLRSWCKALILDGENYLKLW